MPSVSVAKSHLKKEYWDARIDISAELAFKATRRRLHGANYQKERAFKNRLSHSATVTSRAPGQDSADAFQRREIHANRPNLPREYPWRTQGALQTCNQSTTNCGKDLSGSCWRNSACEGRVSTTEPMVPALGRSCTPQGRHHGFRL